MICFHHTDPDGWCSAAIVKKFYHDRDIKFYPITYGQNVPYDMIGEDEEVWIVDYSFTPEQWDKLFHITPNVYWFDHHKTAIMDPEAPLNLKGVRQDGVAACELVWKYFYPDIKLPRAVELVADYDVWVFKFEPQTKWFFHGLINNKEAKNPDSDLWVQLLNDDSISNDVIGERCIEGKMFKEYIDRVNKGLVTHKSNIIWFEGLRLCVVNNQTYGSAVFDSIDPALYDGVSIFAWFGKFWKISFYTVHDDVDMSKIAVLYGGGGHRAACGCELKRLPFDFTNIVKYDEDGNAIIPSTTIGSRIRRWAMHRWCRGRLW